MTFEEFLENKLKEEKRKKPLQAKSVSRFKDFKNYPLSCQYGSCTDLSYSFRLLKFNTFIVTLKGVAENL